MYHDISLGQYIPVQSTLHKLDPRSKIAATSILVMAAFMADFPEQVSLLLLLVAVLIWVSRVSLRDYLKALRSFLFIIIITALMQMFFTGGENLLNLRFITVSFEGVLAAASFTVRFVIILLAVRILTATTTPMAMTRGLEKVLEPFKRMGFPVHELVMIMTISLRFIPLYIEEAGRIRKAQICRGADYREGPLVKRAIKLTSFLVPLFRISFQRAGDLAQAMEARAYRGGEGRTHLYRLQMRLIDYLYILLIAAISVIGLY
ncbi:MAG: energy-coupling factor transporter transmembrane protein EcfT [Syntrophomonadaceae bacterium]|nr:energy-coupling factor transporter transmembrane protein EcfT [Syntrophomonadaceae bacterium]